MGRAGETIAAPKSRLCLSRGAFFVERALGVIVAFLLLKSAFSHIANPYQFLAAIYEYELIEPVPGKWFAVVLPFLQLVIAGCILVRVLHTESYLLGALMFAGFVAVQFSATRRGLQISCGCFGGIGGEVVGPRTIAVATSGLIGCLIGFALSACLRSSSGREVK